MSVYRMAVVVTLFIMLATIATLSSTAAGEVPVTDTVPVLSELAVPAAVMVPAVLPDSSHAIAALEALAIRRLDRRVKVYQKVTWKWQRLMGHALTPTTGRVLAHMSITDIRTTLKSWKFRATRARLQAQSPPHLSQFLCIHHYEGSWTDSGAPYYGGLQMDVGFQQSYGGWLYAKKGTADHWTTLEQIWTAEKAFRVRGFWPWPNTARFCGLI